MSAKPITIGCGLAIALRTDWRDCGPYGTTDGDIQGSYVPGDRICAQMRDLRLRTGIGGFSNPFGTSHTHLRPSLVVQDLFSDSFLVLCQWCPLSLAVFRALSSCLSLIHQLLLLLLLTRALSWLCNCAAISDRFPRKEKLI
jgi:hypothetical protein